MILFFHFIFLITKYIVCIFSKSKSNKDDLPENECEYETDGAHRSPTESNNLLQNHTNLAGESKYIEGSLKFFPPVYVQRYEAVFLILQEPPWKDTIRKVVDFGCSEMGFFLYLKQLQGVEEILEVDIDESILERYCTKASPFYSDYLFCKRSKPLDVYLLAGSISDYDDHLSGTDAVVAIEVIEHLKPDVLRKMPQNIFQRIKPRVAVFTTPNADFNVLFPSPGLRHADHQFEWSRKEFYKWTREITDKYRDYTVKFYGIGIGPEGTENLGCCTQMAVFERREEFQLDSIDLTPTGINNYKLIRKIEYPFFVDSRTDEEKIIDEVLYRLKFSLDKSEYYNCEEYCTEIPLKEFMLYVEKWCPSSEQLQIVLENHGFIVRYKDGDSVLVYNEPIEESSESNREPSEECGKAEYAGARSEDRASETWDSDENDENESPRNSYRENAGEEPNFQSARSLQNLSNSTRSTKSPRVEYNDSVESEYSEVSVCDKTEESDGSANSVRAEDIPQPSYHKSCQETSCFGLCGGGNTSETRNIPKRRSCREVGIRTSTSSKVLKSWIHSHIGL